jgi:hypothetical protein
MNIWEVLMLLAGGLFAGAVTAFAWERLPAWRALPLQRFKPDFATTINVADRVQPALLGASIVTAVAFAITESGTARTLALIGVAGFVVTMVASFAVLVPLQRRIIASPGEGSDVEAMRQRWFQGHLGRSVLAVVSFTLVAVAAAYGG